MPALSLQVRPAVSSVQGRHPTTLNKSHQMRPPSGLSDSANLPIARPRGQLRSPTQPAPSNSGAHSATYLCRTRESRMALASSRLMMMPIPCEPRRSQRVHVRNAFGHAGVAPHESAPFFEPQPRFDFPATSQIHPHRPARPQTYLGAALAVAEPGQEQRSERGAVKVPPFIASRRRQLFHRQSERLTSSSVFPALPKRPGRYVCWNTDLRRQ